MSVGVTPWTDDDSIWSNYTLDDADDLVQDMYFHVRWYLFAADQGADQKGGNRLILLDVADKLLVI